MCVCPAVPKHRLVGFSGSERELVNERQPFLTQCTRLTHVYFFIFLPLALFSLPLPPPTALTSCLCIGAARRCYSAEWSPPPSVLLSLFHLCLAPVPPPPPPPTAPPGPAKDPRDMNNNKNIPRREKKRSKIASSQRASTGFWKAPEWIPAMCSAALCQTTQSRPAVGAELPEQRLLAEL